MASQLPLSFPVTLDRIEGEFAVLLCGEETIIEWRLPRAWLPAEAQEGERLFCLLTRELPATAEAQVHNTALRQTLPHLSQRKSYDII